MPERDRDQSVEHLLRRVLSHDGPASPGDACVDGETMAAWTAGALRTDEASAVERHVSGCARCRALMAAFIKTTPDEPPTESLWRRWHLGWAVPLATAATAAAIWISLPASTTVSVPSLQDRDTLAEAARSEIATGAAQAPPAPAETAPAPPAATAARERVERFASNEEKSRPRRNGRSPSIDSSCRAGGCCRAAGQTV